MTNKYPLLCFFALAIIAIVIKFVVDARKREREWIMARDEEFKRRMEKEFDEWFKGRVAAHMVGKVIFQFWRAKKLITYMALPAGQLCVLVGTQNATDSFISATETTELGLKWKQLLAPIMVDGGETAGKPTTPLGTVTLYWLTVNGWEYLEMTDEQAAGNTALQKAFSLSGKMESAYARLNPADVR